MEEGRQKVKEEDAESRDYWFSRWRTEPQVKK
jgi:hypothetical protein